jgi:hypothetical protein
MFVARGATVVVKGRGRVGRMSIRPLEEVARDVLRALGKARPVSGAVDHQPSNRHPGTNTCCMHVCIHLQLDFIKLEGRRCDNVLSAVLLSSGCYVVVYLLEQAHNNQ